MKNITVVALAFLGPILVGAPAWGADPTLSEEIYFESHVSKGNEVLVKPHALVRVGADAELSVSPKNSGPRFTIKYVVRHAIDGGFIATVKGLVDAREVVAGIMAIPRDSSAATTLEGGGYTWHVTSERMTPELMKRRQSRK